MSTYEEFLIAKLPRVEPVGFEPDPLAFPAALFPWQREIVEWSCRHGRTALFADCGLGKTAMQLAWATQVYLRTLKPVLILAPLAVAQQTAREGAKFGVPVRVCRSQADVVSGVNVANYEMLGHFDPAAFGGVVLDESSILKAYMGKRKQEILAAFRHTPYRLACTATPAPNDHLELGNHAEFLGIMPSNEMISRWFINDTMAAGSYRLKGHAERDFWRWVSSWAVSLSKPSDLGYPDDGFELPPLDWITHIVEVDLTQDAPAGCLFRMPKLSSTALGKEKRLTLGERAAQVADLVHETPGPWVLWCDLNDEADELRRRIPEAIEVRGPDALAEKERKLDAFSRGEERVLITKPSICGFGMNWQHCSQMAFVGLSYSYEQLYQALRRSWRFGQVNPVSAHIVMAESEGPVLSTLQRKQAQHEQMKAAMNAAMRETRLGGPDGRLGLRLLEGRAAMQLPQWLGKAA